MTRRADVSGVALQGGYVAKQCPVRAQNDALIPVEPLPPSPILERRFEQGRQFEFEVLVDLLSRCPEALVVDGEPQALEAATVEAMTLGIAVIAGGRLPADELGRRVGKPDLLVAAGGGGYRAVDIQHHMALEPAERARQGLPGRCATMDRPFLESSGVDETWYARKRKEDLLQLAHYQRILETARLAPAEGRYGAILGVERRVVWYDLDAPIWRTPSSAGRQKLRSTMEVYDFEFDFRLDIIAVAQAHALDPSVALKVVPIRISECPECPWWDYCRPQLQAGSGDISLLPRVGWRDWRIHRDHGVTDRAELAALDIPTAWLVAAGVDVAGLLAAAQGKSDASLIAELPTIAKRPAQLEKLRGAGVLTVGDASRLSTFTASYSDVGLASLPEQIDLARAALGPAPVYRKRGVGEVTVPRADVEVDIDMENVEDGVYLWGALLTDRSRRAPGAYHPFVTWEPLTMEVETQNFLRFWQWLAHMRMAALEGGRTFRAFCYSGAEDAALRTLGQSAGLLGEVEEFVGSEDWVDMLRVFNAQLITGDASGLKKVAPLAGFSWDVNEPGGAESMLVYDSAVGSPNDVERQEARRWLLDYNRGDVAATFAIRDWLERAGESIAPIESADP